MKTLKGTVFIGAMRQSVDKRWIEIQLTDESSGCRAVTIKVSLADFAQAAFGSSEANCEYEWNDSGLVGKIYEHKTEIVARPTDHREGFARAQAMTALAPYEVDGWKGRVRDALNHHNWVGNDMVKVLFVRYVDPPTEEGEAQ